MARKISQYKTVNEVEDTSTYIPIITGFQPANKKITVEKLLEPVYDTINQVSEDLSAKATISEVAAKTTNVLGHLTYNSVAPTPERNGKYIFINSGKCLWLTGTPTVELNDEVIVTYNSENDSYSYTHIPIDSVYATNQDISDIQEKLDKKIDGAYAQDGLLYLTIDGMPIGTGITVGTSSGGGGGTSLTDVTIRAISGTTLSVAYVDGGQTQANIYYTFLSTYKGETGDTGNGTATYYVKGLPVFVDNNLEQGESCSFNIGPYLSSGENRVSVTITDSIGTWKTLSYTINAVSLSISSPFDATKRYDGQVSFRYTPIGSAGLLKTVYFLIDGIQIATAQTTYSGIQYTQTLPQQLHGAHTLDVYMESFVGGVTIASNRLHYDVIWIDLEDNTPIVASSFTPKTVTQYETINIPYIVYNNTSSVSNVTYSVNGNVIRTLTGVTRDTQTFSYRTTTSGDTTLAISCSGVTKSFTIPVAGSLVTSQPYSHDVDLYLASAGRNNNEENRNIWEYQGEDNTYIATLENFVYGTTDGWLLDSNGNTVLRVAGDARVNIPFKIFDKDFKEFGKTIEIEFATKNIVNYDSIVIDCMSGDKGIQIKTQSAILKSEQSSISTKFKEDERVRISFVVESDSENLLMYGYVNGIMSSAVLYNETDNFRQASPVNLTIGSSGCTTDIYCIRIYDTDLRPNQVLNNYIYDMDNIDNKVHLFKTNQLFDDYGNIEYDKVLQLLPCMILTGPLPTYKGDKKSIRIDYENAQDPTFSFIAYCKEGKTDIDVQGTSSQYYPRKNYKLSLKNADLYQNGSSTPLSKSKYKLRSNSVGAPTYTIKADFAEASGTHNTGLAVLADEMLKGMGRSYLTPPQKKQYDAVSGTSTQKINNVNIRTTVDGFPIAVFTRDAVGGELTFLGKYNFNIDKGSTDVYGFTDEEIDESWEFLNNTSPRVKFRISEWTNTYFDTESQETKYEWQQDFEARYPDLDTPFNDYTNLKILFDWIVSTDPTTATNTVFDTIRTFHEIDPISGNLITYSSDSASYRLAKFKNEVHEHFNVENLVSYYLITEIFGMVDQRAKNMFLTSWGNEGSGEYKWYFILYDNDTALGINNEGVNIFDYSIEYHDHVDKNNSSSAYVWNGESSLLWYQVEQAFPSMLQEMYHSMRSSGVISYDIALNTFNTRQSDKWSESIYNEDSRYKYIEPYTIGFWDGESQSFKKVSTYLYALQGSRNEHRKWWLYNRFKYLDSKYTAGDYESDFATMRIYTPSGSTVEAVMPNPDFRVKPIANQYCKVKYGAATGSYSATQRGWAEEYSYLDAPVPEGTIFNDTETIIYGISRLKDIGDLSNKYPGTVDLSKATRLEKLIVGSPLAGYDNPNLGGSKEEGKNQTFSVGSSQLLRLVDIRNCSGLVDPLDVSKCLNIEEIYAKGSSITSVALPNGGYLKTLQLPSTIASLTIKNQPFLNTGFTIESYTKIKTLRIENTPGIDVLNIVEQCYNNGTTVLDTVRLIGVNGTTNNPLPLLYIAQHCSGLSETGADLPNQPVINGYVTITTSMTETDQNTLRNKFGNDFHLTVSVG